MAGRNIIRSTQVRIVIFPLKNSLELTFSNIAYTPKCGFHLISLGQLLKTGILYHDHLKYIVRKLRRKTIKLTTKKKNLFILNTQILDK